MKTTCLVLLLALSVAGSAAAATSKDASTKNDKSTAVLVKNFDAKAGTGDKKLAANKRAANGEVFVKVGLSIGKVAAKAVAKGATGAVGGVGAGVTR